MKFTEDYAIGVNVIRGYDASSVSINNKTYNQSLIVSSNSLIEDWSVIHVTDLNAEALSLLLELKPEVILIGTGDKLEFPHPKTYANIINQGIGIEFMDSGAACRTYNVLISESRNVVAGIIL